MHNKVKIFRVEAEHTQELWNFDFKIKSKKQRPSSFDQL